MKNNRKLALQAWCEARIGMQPNGLESVSGDASFRRYFRAYQDHRSVIAVDAPPPQESLQPFMAIAKAYAAAGIQVPAVIDFDEEQGFMLLSDFGSTLLLAELTEANAPRYYQQALATLPQIMQVTATELGPLPRYDEALLRRELNLFYDWLVTVHLGLDLSPEQNQIWQNFAGQLIDNALEQPQVGVHRDYHARNLMVTSDSELGCIDFQDAVVGPITYDAVSLLRDCYVRWPETLVDELCHSFYQQLQQTELLAANVSWQQFQRWFDLMGLQRHSKAAGIFARLYHRDGKAGYLQDIPNTLNYMLSVSDKYPQFSDFHTLLADVVLPAWEQMQ
ncbi:aminoglycoside phosphotransferase family protein [Pseudidiomarina taiwanensis]|uniref:Serine/threonine protein kinase n=1 Tax=Pseudidiomarina taiwanensis TaxID=337250 RepID=A0A432ZC98_9GAMM|nr:phosphotransferase [Pseudidiomarina taiwanensis]RUO75597.1 serine/threonine protein kinase [Pseudidiomarina taiwanensis]